MVMNRKQSAFGVVERVEENKDYKGVTTETATVSVNNSTREISVDVDFRGMLGEAPDKAYPGHLGADTRNLVLGTAEKLDIETTRAKEAEATLHEEIISVAESIDQTHDEILAEIEKESLRAASAEQELNVALHTQQEDLEALSEHVDARFEQVAEELRSSEVRLYEAIASTESSVLNQLDQTEAILHSDIEATNVAIKATEQDLTQDINALDTRLTTRLTREISNINNTLSETESYLNSSIVSTRRELTTQISNVGKNLSSQIFVLEDQTQTNLATTEARLKSDIKQTEQKLSKNINELDTKFKSRTDELATSISTTNQTVKEETSKLRTSIDEIKRDYADKIYVDQKLVEYSKLSKRVVDEVNVEDNFVVINGEKHPPVDNVVYLVKDQTLDGQDTYKQYATIDGRLTLIGDTKINLDNYATIEYVQTEIASIPEVDLSDYAKITDIPDVSEFINEIPSEYITEDELEDKGYLTEHQSLAAYATKSYVQAEISKVGTLTKLIVESIDIEQKTYVLNGIENTVEPDVIYLVPNIDQNIYNQYTLIDDTLVFIGSTDIDLKGYATIEYVDNAISNIPEVDLTPYAKLDQVPQNLSQLTNDVNYITAADVPEVDLSDYAKLSDIPDVSEFINEIPEEYITEEELEKKSYCTEATVRSMLTQIKFINGGTSADIMI